MIAFVVLPPFTLRAAIAAAAPRAESTHDLLIREPLTPSLADIDSRPADDATALANPCCSRAD